LARLPQFTPNIYQIGVGVALASLSAFFIGLILAYSLRIQVQPVWRQFHVPNYLWFSTAALAASSAVLEGAKYSLRRAAISKYRWRLQLCLVLGITFLVLQTTSATDLLHQGVAAEGNPHGSAFYVFMSIHAVHLLGGLGWLGYLYARSRKLYDTTENHLRKHRVFLAVAATYWHFMGVVWVVLFFFLILWTGR
jgi:cytochrome c oxidase subunit 3